MTHTFDLRRRAPLHRFTWTQSEDLGPLAGFVFASALVALLDPAGSPHKEIRIGAPHLPVPQPFGTAGYDEVRALMSETTSISLSFPPRDETPGALRSVDSRSLLSSAKFDPRSGEYVFTLNPELLADEPDVAAGPMPESFLSVVLSPLRELNPGGPDDEGSAC